MEAGKKTNIGRIDTSLRNSDCCYCVPHMAIRIETGSCRTKVGRTPALKAQLLTFAIREMQVFLLGYILIEICEIFTVGKFPLKDTVRIVSGCNIEDEMNADSKTGIHWNTSGLYRGYFMDPDAQCGRRISVTR